MDDDGHVVIGGRMKDTIIRGGENIYPAEVEQFLYKHPKIADVQVMISIMSSAIVSTVYPTFPSATLGHTSWSFRQYTSCFHINQSFICIRPHGSIETYKKQHPTHKSTIRHQREREKFIAKCCLPRGFVSMLNKSVYHVVISVV